MASSPKERKSARKDRFRPRVLLIDDDPAIAAFVRSSLPANEYDLVCAASVNEGLASLAATRPDLAIVSLSLPDGSGWDVLAPLREDPGLARLPIVVFTASREVPDREKSLRLGADRFLVKPVEKRVLRRVVNELLVMRDDVWWALSMPELEVKRMRALLFDDTTDLPTLALVVEELRTVLERGEALHVYCLELEPLFHVGERHSWASFDQLRREFVRGLHVVVAPLAGPDVLIATSHAGANDFYLFSPHPTAFGSDARVARDLGAAGRKLLDGVDSGDTMSQDVAIFAGGTVTPPDPLHAPRLIYDAVREAKNLAERREVRYFNTLRERLMHAIRERSVATVFQPIFDLGSGRIHGFEALSRGPAGTEIESPEVMFELARDLHLVWELEALCIANVLPDLQDICGRGLLFFNLEPQFIQQLHSRGTAVLEPLLSCQGEVVIEVTERSAIRDYAGFRRTLRDLKAMGFKIAIDDCGSGYATLESVAELHPEYLKVGHSLLDGVENDPVRRSIVELVARTAEIIQATTVAEAIESEAQLRVCREIGIPKGQGFFLTRPAPWAEIRALFPKGAPRSVPVYRQAQRWRANQSPPSR
jgi:EAL domain-containing protein (putative c-di-GMP-specific phosphodiesterase class I)/DNA-binding response OmpR family regulator